VWLVSSSCYAEVGVWLCMLCLFLAGTVGLAWLGLRAWESISKLPVPYLAKSDLCLLNGESAECAAEREKKVGESEE